MSIKLGWINNNLIERESIYYSPLVDVVKTKTPIPHNGTPYLRKCTWSMKIQNCLWHTFLPWSIIEYQWNSDFEMNVPHWWCHVRWTPKTLQTRLTNLPLALLPFQNFLDSSSRIHRFSLPDHTPVQWPSLSSLKCTRSEYMHPKSTIIWTLSSAQSLLLISPLSSRGVRVHWSFEESIVGVCRQVQFHGMLVKIDCCCGQHRISFEEIPHKLLRNR